MLNKNIDIKTSSRADEKEYFGLCIAYNEEILVLLNFNEETSVYDGFTIFRNYDVEFYREWDSVDFAKLKQDNSEALLNDIDLSCIKSFESAFQYLNSKLIAVYTYNDLESYYVGKVESLIGNELSLQLITKEAEWIDFIKLNIESIWYIGFDSTYEKQLIKDAL